VERELERADSRIAKVAPAEIWKEEAGSALRALGRLTAQGAIPERRSSLQEWTCRTLINLGVDANAVGDYRLALEITSAAAGQARSPVQHDLCTGNMTVYANNLSRNLRPPGRK